MRKFLFEFLSEMAKQIAIIKVMEKLGSGNEKKIKAKIISMAFEGDFSKHEERLFMVVREFRRLDSQGVLTPVEKAWYSGIISGMHQTIRYQEEMFVEAMEFPTP